MIGIGHDGSCTRCCHDLFDTLVICRHDYVDSIGLRYLFHNPHDHGLPRQID
jgi:hypothetical protein